MKVRAIWQALSKVSERWTQTGDTIGQGLEIRKNGGDKDMTIRELAGLSKKIQTHKQTIFLDFVVKAEHFK